MTRIALQRRSDADSGQLVRLAPEADAALRELARKHDLTRREILERLLLGLPIDRISIAMREHGLSYDEARQYVHG